MEQLEEEIKGHNKNGKWPLTGVCVRA